MALPCRVVLHGRGHALIQRHHDVRANGLLRRDAALGTQADGAVVDIAFELGAIPRRMLRLSGREKIWKPPESVSTERGQFMKPWMPPNFSNISTPGSQHQVIGIGEQHLRAAVEQILAALRRERRHAYPPA